MPLHTWPSSTCASHSLRTASPFGRVRKVLTLPIHNHLVAVADLTTQDSATKRCFQILLDRTLQRTRAIHRVIPHLSEVPGRFRSQLNIDVSLRETYTHSVQLKVEDLLEVLFRERMEDHNLIDTVQELGTEVMLHLRKHGSLHPLVSLRVGLSLVL